MTTVRSDLLRVCNDQSVPLPDFKLAFCDRCMQPECTRSRVGQSQFEQRINNWHEKLFVAPPRLESDDPRYAQITGQRFLMVDPGPVPEVFSKSWVDPRDLSDQNPSVAQPKAITTPNRLVPESPTHTEAFPPVAVEKKDLFRVASINTPIQAPKMLNNAEKPTPKVDPWAGSETPPSSSEEKIVQPGTKVRLGGGSGV